MSVLPPGAVTHPMPVIRQFLVEDGFLVEEALAEDLARRDDAYWRRLAAGPWRGWQAFTSWWVARRWVQPRDVRRR